MRISSSGSYEQPIAGAGAGGAAPVITPFYDFNEVILQGDAGRGRRFVSDHRLYANVTRGARQPPAPDTDWGHYQPDYGTSRIP